MRKVFILSEIALSKIEIDSANLAYYYFRTFIWLSIQEAPQLRAKIREMKVKIMYRVEEN